MKNSKDNMIQYRLVSITEEYDACKRWMKDINTIK